MRLSEGGSVRAGGGATHLQGGQTSPQDGRDYSLQWTQDSHTQNLSTSYSREAVMEGRTIQTCYWVQMFQS